MKQRIALVEPPSSQKIMRDMYSSTISKLGYSWPNVDLLSISGQLRDEFECKIFDFSSSNINRHKGFQILKSFAPKHIVFSYGESNGKADLSFIKYIKEQILPKDGKVFGTGGSLIHNPQRFLQNHSWLNGIVLNYAFSSLSDHLNGKKNPVNLFLKGHKGRFQTIKKTDPKPNFDIPPGLHEHLSLDNYFLPQLGSQKFTSIATSWGCPYKCSFCVSSSLSYRMRSAKSIFNEILYCNKLGINSFFFRDNVFGINKKQLKELGQMLELSGKKITFISDTRVDLINDEVVLHFSKIGRAALNFGIETKNEETLTNFSKGLNNQDTSRILKKCRAHNITTTGYFILGLEGETEQDVRNTIRYAKKLPLNFASFNLPIPIEGTKLREEAISNNLIDEDALYYDGSGQSVVPNQNIELHRLKYLQRLAYKQFYFRFKILFWIGKKNLGLKPFRKLTQAVLLLFEWKKF